MFIHSVYFWLKPECNPDQVADFRRGLETLEEIEATDGVFIGTPAKTDRPVVDRTYSFAMTVVLRGKDEHDAYQLDPIHQAFLGKFAEYWSKVVIYDFD